MEYSELLKGKRVCLCGAAASLEGKGLGHVIDGYDVVIRLGDCLPIPAESMRDYGKRTDILYDNLWLWRPEFNGAPHSEAIIAMYKEAGLHFRYGWIEQEQLTHFLSKPGAKEIPMSIMDRNVFVLASNILATCPTKGFLAILDLVNQPIKSLYVCGMTFFRKHGYAKYYTHNALYSKKGEYDDFNKVVEDTINVSGHDPEAELRQFIAIFKEANGKIKVDDTLRQIMAEEEAVMAKEQPPSVYIALPNYDGKSHVQQNAPIYWSGLKDGVQLITNYQSSILTSCFNYLLCDALNNRGAPHHITHFLMVHADIVPNHGFVKIMLAEMRRHKCDVLSAISPIKDANGYTSTGYNLDDSPWEVKRWTMKEIYAMPPTFTHPDIVVNTGLMLIDLRAPWVEKIFFHMEDEIIKDKDGKFHMRVQPEDWNFSYRARKLGAKIYATRRVHIKHQGEASYYNDSPWGLKEVG